MWNQLRRLLARVFGSSQDASRELRSTNARARFWADVREGEREAERASRSETSIGEERLDAARPNQENEACCKSVVRTTITDAPS